MKKEYFSTILPTVKWESTKEKEVFFAQPVFSSV
jgi:hypothetical protein